MDGRATALDHQAWPSWGARKQIIILLSKVTVVTPSPQIANNLPVPPQPEGLPQSVVLLPGSRIQSDLLGRVSARGPGDLLTWSVCALKYDNCCLVQEGKAAGTATGRWASSSHPWHFARSLPPQH